MRGSNLKQLVYSSKSLGITIARQRRIRKQNQSEVGKPFKIEQSTISSIERGAQGTRIETIFRILAALDLEMVIQSKPQENKKIKEEW